MADPTPEMLAMARRIANDTIPGGLDETLPLRKTLRAIAEQAALAAIKEATEAAVELADVEAKGCAEGEDGDYWIASHIARSLRNMEHLK